MTIDALGTERHFVDHLAAIWDALPVRRRGRFVVSESLAPYARSLGLKPQPELPVTQRPTLVASYGDLKRARRADRQRLILTEHGAGQSYSGDHPSYAGGRDRGDVGLFLVPNEHAGDRNRAACPDADVAVVGCARLDELPEREASEDQRPTIAISFHWNCQLSLESRPAFRAFRLALPQLARSYRVLGHGHPRMIDRIRPNYERLGIEVVRDFADVCRRADLYICDNSSTLFEFAATGRPVVVMNAPWYRRRIRHGLRFWDAASVGIQVNDSRGMVAAVQQALIDPPEQRAAREAALDVVYARRTGAAKRAADAIVGWAA